MEEVEAFILRKPDVILGATVFYSVWGETAKVLWYMNPKAENGGIRVRKSKLAVSRCVPT